MGWTEIELHDRAAPKLVELLRGLADGLDAELKTPSLTVRFELSESAGWERTPALLLIRFSAANAESLAAAFEAGAPEGAIEIPGVADLRLRLVHRSGFTFA